MKTWQRSIGVDWTGSAEPRSHADRASPEEKEGKGKRICHARFDIVLHLYRINSCIAVHRQPWALCSVELTWNALQKSWNTSVGSAVLPLCCFFFFFSSSSSTNITWSYMSSWKPVGGRCPWYTNSEKALHVAVVLSVREQTQVNGEHPAGIAQAREGRPQLRFLWTQRTLRPLRTSPRNTSLRRSMKFMKHIETHQVDPFQWSFAFLSNLGLVSASRCHWEPELAPPLQISVDHSSSVTKHSTRRKQKVAKMKNYKNCPLSRCLFMHYAKLGKIDQ